MSYCPVTFTRKLIAIFNACQRVYCAWPSLYTGNHGFLRQGRNNHCDDGEAASVLSSQECRSGMQQPTRNCRKELAPLGTSNRPVVVDAGIAKVVVNGDSRNKTHALTGQRMPFIVYLAVAGWFCCRCSAALEEQRGSRNGRS